MKDKKAMSPVIMIVIGLVLALIILTIMVYWLGKTSATLGKASACEGAGGHCVPFYKTDIEQKKVKVECPVGEAKLFQSCSKALKQHPDKDKIKMICCKPME